LSVILIFKGDILPKSIWVSTCKYQIVQVVAGPTGIQTAREMAAKLDVNEVIPEYKIFPDGETYIRLPDQLDDEIIIVQSCYYPQDSNLFQLLNLIRTVKQIVDAKITCYIPYMCYARMDRSVHPGEAITINTVLYLLEAVGVDHLITLDIHNPDVLNRTKMKTTNVYPKISMKNYLVNHLNQLQNLQVVAPDQGALGRAKSLADELEIGYTALYKKRDPTTGNVDLRLGDAEFTSNEVIIVDDIISTGGTLVKASNLLTINGISTIHYLITHALGTESVDKLREIGNGLVVATDSIKTVIGKISAVEDIIRVI